MKGYKTRRIFFNNKDILKYRDEFREIIQFAYTLKQDIKSESKNTKMLLLTSLKELIQKKLQFSEHFYKLLNG